MSGYTMSKSGVSLEGSEDLSEQESTHVKANACFTPQAAPTGRSCLRRALFSFCFVF